MSQTMQEWAERLKRAAETAPPAQQAGYGFQQGYGRPRPFTEPELAEARKVVDHMTKEFK